MTDLVPNLSTACVLLVEDDRALRELVATYLRQNALNVIEAGDGMEMRAALAREAIDLIVLDLMLPGEDGLSLLRSLRAQSETPVIIASARGDEVDRIVGLEVGADDYLANIWPSPSDRVSCWRGCGRYCDVPIRSKRPHRRRAAVNSAATSWISNSTR